MSSGLKITVVTPSYNQGQFLEQTIRSVLEQDYPNIEYMVIDGGSTDNSKDILLKYSDSLSYWVSRPDSGQADAIAKGFAMASGDILCWINSDDVFLPGALSKVAEFFARYPRAEVVTGGCYYIDTNGAPLIDKLPWDVYTFGSRATYNQFRFYGMGMVRQQSTFWRRNAYEAVGGIDGKLQFIMDRDLFIRLASRQHFRILPRMLATFRHHDMSKSCTILDVWAKEDKIFAERYGRNEYSYLIRRFMYWRYRIPILVAKVFLFVLRRAGVVRLGSISFRQRGQMQ